MDSDCIANGNESLIKSMKVDGGASQNNLLMQVTGNNIYCIRF